MSTARSAIEWTDATWNPVRGCGLVSPGCTNCYAMKQAHRFSGKGQPYEALTIARAHGGPVWSGEARFIPDALAEPLRWRTPKRIFVNSMSDLFHEDIADEEIATVFGVMALAPRHTFQLLTKRADRALSLVARLTIRDCVQMVRLYDVGLPEASMRAADAVVWLETEHPSERFPFAWPLPNVWLGVSVENQKYADERVPLLLKTPAAVRFVSAEPLIEGVDLSAYLECDMSSRNEDDYRPGLSWVIVGGESGPGARPFCTSWAMNIVADCEEAGVPVFVKQLGARPYRVLDDADDIDVFDEDDVDEWLDLDDRKGGDPEEWPAFLRRREFPTKEAPR